MKAQTIRITIDELNFNYTDVQGGYKVSNANQEGLVDHNWNTDVWSNNEANNKHKLEKDFDHDAQYAFTISYTDPAGNPAVIESGEPLVNSSGVGAFDEKFVIDREAPKASFIVESEVGTPGPRNVLAGLLHFFQGIATVDVTAVDTTAGIQQIQWSYEREDGVSAVNTASTGTNTIVANGEQSVKLEIPLKGNYRGKVTVLSVDRSANVSESYFWFENGVLNEVVVDSIAPNGEVTYNAPVDTVDGVAYYDEPITGTITINEANFFSDDVTVTLNGQPLTVNWTDQSADQHFGTFSIAEDGENYIVEITYTDRSGNGPFTYKSEPMTIDTVAPVITLTGIENESANNDETIGFGIEAKDQNLESSAFTVELTRVMKKESADGNTRYTYTTENVPIGAVNVSTDADGETVLSYTVENLPDDGFYFLTATVRDNAGHKISEIVTPSGQKTDEVRFSVNREGSVYWVETRHNDKYTDQWFENLLGDKEHYYANDSVTVTVHEVNVDRVDVSGDKENKTIFTLNDGSSATQVELAENTNYVKNHQVGSGGWYETTYTLDDSNFDHDGVYSFNLVSYDSAGNGNVNSKQESGMLSFVLDRTPPAITANVRSGQRINDTAYTVEFKIAELNLEEDSVNAQLLDNRGGQLRAEMSSLGNNEYVLPIGTGLEMSLTIDARDLAGNPAQTLVVDRLTVSDNFLVLWYANKPLFWGSIGGVAILGGSMIWALVGRKKKSEVEA